MFRLLTPVARRRRILAAVTEANEVRDAFPTTERARLVREPFCGLSHLAGAAVSLAAVIYLLVVAGGRPWHVVSFAVYGTSLVLLFTASGLAHSLYCGASAQARLDRLDYAAIFVLIAGTYTPLCLVTLRGSGWSASGWALLGAQWLLAGVGVAAVLLGRPRSHALRTALYLVMGWMALTVAPAITDALPPPAIAWLVAGGAVYSAGAVIFLTRRPALWPGRFGSHDLWHSLVLAGSACHYVVMARYVA
jgi:hemolysin III